MILHEISRFQEVINGNIWEYDICSAYDNLNITSKKKMLTTPLNVFQKYKSYHNLDIVMYLDSLSIHLTMNFNWLKQFQNGHLGHG